MAESPLWTPDPSSVPGLPISVFAAEAARRAGKPIEDYDALHAWSVADPGSVLGPGVGFLRRRR